MSDFATQIAEAYGISSELADLVVSTAAAVQADPGHLAALINYETAGTWSPSVKNPNSSATGLIQFLESTAQDLGTSTAQLATMTAVEQMAYVQAYLVGKAKTYGPLSIESDLYMSVFYPKAIGKGLDYEFNSSVTAVNASNTTRDYFDAVNRKRKLGALLSSSSTPRSVLLLLAAAAVLVASQ